MKTYQINELHSLDRKQIDIEACCKDALDNLNKGVWKNLVLKIVHNWKTRNKLKELTELQRKDVGLTKSDVDKEMSKPLWK